MKDFKVNSAETLTQITEDRSKLQQVSTNEINRLQNMQNKFIGLGDDYVVNTYNQQAANTRAGQQQIQNQTTADLYSSQLNRDNYGLMMNQASADLSSLYTENVNKGLSAATSGIYKGASIINKLESKKQGFALKEAQTIAKKKLIEDKIRLNWAKYDLTSDKLDFTIDTNKRQEAITEIGLD